ncbi:ELAV-like protein 1 [Haliotis cracherodii]|uniref:ELAV-like protein 1 n=1 Tax=Haliotis cracherodii TaxID=6455 RepID=UPI001EB04309
MADNSNTNLIINYLPQTLSDEEFRSMFLSIGPIKSCKIVRDKSSGYSYGFGFVDYEDEDDAQRAIKTLNGLQMQNKKIKVALARHGGDAIKGANLYVRNLPREWREEEVHSYFEPYGKIIQTRVLVDPNTGVSKRVGFVLYDTRSEADAACSALGGKNPPGSNEALLVKFADDNAKKLRPPPGYQQHQSHHHSAGYSNRFPSPGPMRNQRNRFHFNPMGQGHPGQGPYSQAGGHILFVYNIGTDADEKLLWQLFAPCGTVQKVNVIMDTGKGCCKGYGFVTMTNYEEAEYAIECYNGYWLKGRQLQVSFKN